MGIKWSRSGVNARRQGSRRAGGLRSEKVVFLFFFYKTDLLSWSSPSSMISNTWFSGGYGYGYGYGDEWPDAGEARNGQASRPPFFQRQLHFHNMDAHNRQHSGSNVAGLQWGTLCEHPLSY